MQILALEHEKPGVTAEQFTAALLNAEARRVYELQQAGVIRAIYFRADRAEAVLMLECADAEDAKTVLASLPLVQAGLITFEVIALRPYTGLARLLGAAR